MAKNVETLAKKLGATVVGTVPDYSAGAFGMAAAGMIPLTGGASRPVQGPDSPLTHYSSICTSPSTF